MFYFTNGFRAAADRDLIATAGGDHVVRAASGATDWPDRMAAERLDLTGDPFLRLRFPMLFGLPTAPVPTNLVSTSGGVLDANTLESPART